jgi:hypothetical protein|eukprot:7387198-Prymnesium_polylepis.2
MDEMRMIAHGGVPLKPPTWIEIITITLSLNTMYILDWVARTPTLALGSAFLVILAIGLAFPACCTCAVLPLALVEVLYDALLLINLRISPEHYRFGAISDDNVLLQSEAATTPGALATTAALILIAVGLRGVTHYVYKKRVATAKKPAKKHADVNVALV